MNSSKKTNSKGFSLELQEKQLSHIIAMLLLLFFFVFVGGYYWGKRSGIDDYRDQLDSDVLMDQVKNACYSELSGSESEEVSSSDSDNVSSLLDSDSYSSDMSGNKEEAFQVKEEYAAHLAGFGTYRAAQACVDSYAKHGYTVSISKRTGITAKGKKRTWYQVVTPWYSSKETLQNLIPGFKKVGRLKDVTLVARDKS